MLSIFHKKNNILTRENLFLSISQKAYFCFDVALFFPYFWPKNVPEKVGPMSVPLFLHFSKNETELRIRFFGFAHIQILVKLCFRPIRIDEFTNFKEKISNCLQFFDCGFWNDELIRATEIENKLKSIYFFAPCKKNSKRSVQLLSSNHSTKTSSSNLYVQSQKIVCVIRSRFC